MLAFKLLAAVGIVSLIILIKSATAKVENLKKWKNTVIPVCGDLPPICKYVESRRRNSVGALEADEIYWLFRTEWLVCENRFDETMVRHFERYLHACYDNHKPAPINYVDMDLSISIRFSSQSAILNDTFFIFKSTSWRKDFRLQKLRINNLNGFDIDSYVNGSLNINELDLYTDFNLYKNKSLLKNFSRMPEYSYPLMFIQNPYRRYWRKYSSYMAIYVMNIINNFINNFLFVFVHLVVDLILIRKLRRVILEKEEKAREMKRSEKDMEKLTEDNEESKRRAVIMVICNSSLNFCLKVAFLISTFNDFRLLFHKSNNHNAEHKPTFNNLNLFSSPLTFKFYCLTEKSCQIFQSIGNCLFLLSLSTIFFFLKKFDMNFKSACEQTFSKSTPDTKKKPN